MKFINSPETTANETPNTQVRPIQLIPANNSPLEYYTPIILRIFGEAINALKKIPNILRRPIAIEMGALLKSCN
jgi:hypothetical protein